MTDKPYHKLHDRHIDMMEEQDKPKYYISALWLAIIIATNLGTFVYTMNKIKTAQVNMKLIQKIMHSEEFQLGPYSVEYKCFPVDRD